MTYPSICCRYPRFLLNIVPSPGGQISHSLSLPSIRHYDDRAPHPTDVTTPTIRLVSKSRPQISRPSTQQIPRNQSRLVWSGSKSSFEPKSIKLAKFNKYPIVPSGRTSITVSCTVSDYIIMYYCKLYC